MRLLILSTAMVLMSFIVACSSSPTGRKQLILYSDSQMNEMGVASFAQLKQETPPSKEAKYVNYVQCISRPMLIAAGEKPEKWEIQVFNDETPNAFALPGRKVGVHTGMIKLAQTPDQLAAVIGHEIGHVQARHGAERVSMNIAAGVGQQLSAIALQQNQMGQLATAAIGLTTQFGVLLPYSRKHESEADYIGLKIMAKAGFAPQESVKLWQVMAQLAGGQKPPEFMSTHPSDSTRIKELSKAMPSALAIYKPEARPNCKKP